MCRGGGHYTAIDEINFEEFGGPAHAARHPNPPLIMVWTDFKATNSKWLDKNEQLKNVANELDHLCPFMQADTFFSAKLAALNALCSKRDMTDRNLRILLNRLLHMVQLIKERLIQDHNMDRDSGRKDDGGE